MRTISVNLYQYKELTDEAKKKARDWFRNGWDNYFVWENIDEDAKTVGLVIQELSPYRSNKGRFERYAEDTAKRILENHGTACETYKDAQAFLKGLEELKRDEDGELYIQEQDKAEELEKGFLHSLLEDYRIMLEHEEEYQNSDDVVAENIIANEYEFTEEGDRV